MRKKVYDYFKNNPCSSHIMCAKALGENDLEVLRTIHKLKRDGLLTVQVFALGNTIDSDNSNFYSVCKEYHD